MNTDTAADSHEDREVVKSLRLPGSMYRAAQAMNHPQGFSGVVRDALTAHLGTQPTPDEIRHALEVIQTALLTKVA